MGSQVAPDGAIVVTADSTAGRATWFYDEDVVGRLADPDVRRGRRQARRRLRRPDHRAHVLRDIALLADRAAPDAVADDALITLCRGETATIHVRTRADLDAEQLTSPLVLRTANQLVAAARTDGPTVLGGDHLMNRPVTPSRRHRWRPRRRPGNGAAPSAPAGVGGQPHTPSRFVRVRNQNFEIAGQQFRFGGSNCYYLHQQSHYMIDSVLDDAAAMSLAVLRAWAFADGPAPTTPLHRVRSSTTKRRSTASTTRCGGPARSVSGSCSRW